MRWVEALIGAAIVASLLIYALYGQESQVAYANIDRTWVKIKHESGTVYLLRVSSVIGFIEPVPGDPKGRSGIILSNGHTVTTTITPQQFADLVKVDQ